MQVTPQILTDSEGRRYIVGLHWKRIVTTGAQGTERDALKYARSCGATHVVFTRGQGGEVAAVGCAVLPKGDADVLSLASAFCLRQEDASRTLLAITLDDQQAWLCAVADGLVLNGQDRVLAMGDVDESRNDLLRRHSDGPWRQQGDLPGTQQGPRLADIFEAARAHEPQCLLRPLASYQRKWPARIAAAVAVASVAYVADAAYTRFLTRQRAELDALSLGPRVTADQAWQKLVHDWEQKADIAAPAALSRLLDDFGKVPLELADWDAKNIRCTRTGPRWLCQTRYQRRPESGSTTQSFKQRLPTGWTVDDETINAATARFSVEAPTSPTKVALLPKLADIAPDVMSRLQQTSRAFASQDFGPVSAVKLGTPVDSEGQPMTLDLSTLKPQVVVRQVQVSGPLRSMSVLEGLPISWNVVQVDIAPAHLEQADISISALTVREARGEVYAQQ